MTHKTLKEAYESVGLEEGELRELPLVLIDDDGIRPGGTPDRCFYCRQQVGEEHKFDCVILTKRVKVKFSFSIELEVPVHWSDEQILYKYKESTHCTSNVIREISQGSKYGDNCYCHEEDNFEVEVLGTVRDTPQRQTKEEAQKKDKIAKRK